jgi:hypothetical protein
VTKPASRMMLPAPEKPCSCIASVIDPPP